MRVSTALLALAGPLMIEAQTTNVGQYYTQTFYGDGTFYGQTGVINPVGNCQIDDIPLSMIPGADRTVAINQLQYAGSDACGMCIELTGNPTGKLLDGSSGIGLTPITGTVKAFVDNRCPECLYGSIDNKVNGDGRWPISWKAVPCFPTDVAGAAPAPPVAVKMVDSNPWFVRLQVRLHAAPIKTVEIQNPKTSAWMQLVRQNDNTWQAQFPGDGTTNDSLFPANVRSTSIWGEVVVAKIASKTPGTITTGTSNFQIVRPPGTSPSPPAASPPTTTTQAPTNLRTGAPTRQPTAAPPTSTRAPTAAAPPTTTTSAPTKAPTKAPTAPAPAPPTSTSPTTKICLYGTGCTSSADCAAGLTCQLNNGWSQCIEPSSVTSKTGCVQTNNWCGSGSTGGCCNPSAVCGSSSLCKLPCQA